MKREAALVAALVLALLASTFVETQTVKGTAAAPEVFIEVTDGSYTPYVNQQVELTAVVNGGVQPYRYQWYTIFVPQDLLDKGPQALLDGRVVKVEVPGANSAKFNFTESIPGTYEINLRIIDASGIDIEVGTRFFTVQALPSPLPSPTLFNGIDGTLRNEPINSTINPTYLLQKTPELSQLENLSSIRKELYSPTIVFLIIATVAFAFAILLFYFLKRRHSLNVV